MSNNGDLGNQIFRDIVSYTDDLMEKANQAAADIQKNMMKPAIEAASPIRGKEEKTYSVAGALAPMPASLLFDRKPVQSGGFSKSWVTATFKDKSKNTSVYAVRNKQFRLVHLLNFDHRHFSHSRYTSETHQKHAGFVDDVQARAEAELHRRIEELMEGG